MTATTDKQEQTEVQAWTPMSDLFGWPTRISHLVDSMWHAGMPGEVVPGAELRETDDRFVLEVDLPGLTKKDLSIEVSGRRVTVDGTRSEKEREGILRRTSRVSGRFTLDIALPVAADESQVTASLQNGVLTVTLPKAQVSNPTEVEIK